MRFKYLDLPQVPPNLLITAIAELANLKNIFKNTYYPYYKQYVVPNQELNDYIESIFNHRCFCSYQVIRNGISVHKDIGRTECNNYLIETGGINASLDLYDDKKNLSESIVIPKNKWHWIDVSQFHGVSGLTDTRISISVNKT